MKGAKPQTVLYVHHTADLYGASRSLLRLLPEIKKHGFAPHILLPESGPLQTRLEELGFPVWIDPRLPVITRLGLKSFRLFSFLVQWPLSTRRIWRLLRAQNVRLVHSNTAMLPTPALASRFARVPHLWHIRDDFDEFPRLWSGYRHYMTGLSYRVIAVSNPIAAQFPGAANVAVIHNGLPLDEFPSASAAEAMRAEFRKEYALEGQLVIGCVGRIKFVRKGQEFLVQAAALLKEQGLSCKYLVVGGPAPGNEEHLTRLKHLIQTLRLTDDIVLAGELQNPKPAFAASDIMVLPSAQPEPFGGVVLESMAMRRPVVATAIGGSLDQVVDGQTGFLIPPAQPGELAQKLGQLLRAPNLRQEMGEAGRRRLEQCFTIEQMIGKILALYQSVPQR